MGLGRRSGVPASASEAPRSGLVLRGRFGREASVGRIQRPGVGWPRRGIRDETGAQMQPAMQLPHLKENFLVDGEWAALLGCCLNL